MGRVDCRHGEFSCGGQTFCGRGPSGQVAPVWGWGVTGYTYLAKKKASLSRPDSDFIHPFSSDYIRVVQYFGASSMFQKLKHFLTKYAKNAKNTNFLSQGLLLVVSCYHSAGSDFATNQKICAKSVFSVTLRNFCHTGLDWLSTNSSFWVSFNCWSQGWVC